MLTKLEYNTRLELKWITVSFAFITLFSIVGILIAIILFILIIILNTTIWKEIYLFKTYNEYVSWYYDTHKI